MIYPKEDTAYFVVKYNGFPNYRVFKYKGMSGTMFILAPGTYFRNESVLAVLDEVSGSLLKDYVEDVQVLRRKREKAERDAAQELLEMVMGIHL